LHTPNATAYLENILSNAQVQQPKFFHRRELAIARCRDAIAGDARALPQQPELFLGSELLLSSAPSLASILVSPQLDHFDYASDHLPSIIDLVYL
jgi:hypothetical protein